MRMDQLLYPNWRDQVVFSPEGPQPKTLFEDAKFKTVVAGLEPGQKIPKHPEGAGVYHFLEGTGWMLVGEERFPVQAGSTVLAPSGAARGMEATTRLAFIATRIA